MVESRSQEEMLRLQWAVCPGGWFSLHDVCRCLMLESRSQEEVLRLLWAVCPAGGWFGYMMFSLFALEVGRHGICQIFYKVWRLGQYT